MTTLTAEIVRELLDYDPLTGILTWKRRDQKWFSREADWKRWNTVFAGKEALPCSGPGGYKTGAILNKSQYAHRIAFLHYHGYMPPEVDHLNGDTLDNRIANLRGTTRAENARNSKRSAANMSGFSGVGFARNKWRARAHKDGKEFHIGYFDSKEEAAAAVIAKRREIGGYTERHGT